MSEDTDVIVKFDYNMLKRRLAVFGLFLIIFIAGYALGFASSQTGMEPSVLAVSSEFAGKTMSSNEYDMYFVQTVGGEHRELSDINRTYFVGTMRIWAEMPNRSVVLTVLVKIDESATWMSNKVLFEAWVYGFGSMVGKYTNSDPVSLLFFGRSIVVINIFWFGYVEADQGPIFAPEFRLMAHGGNLDG